MKFKKKYENPYMKTIMIKRAIEVDNDLKKFIFMNSNYRRKVWNDFVAEYYRCRELGEKFNVMEFKSNYYNEIEKPNNVYKTYCTGISESVMKDIINALHLCNLNDGSLNFKKFDKFRCSFKVNCKGHFRDIKDLLPKFTSKVHIVSNDIISFSKKWKDITHIKLKEPLWCDAKPIDDMMYYFTKNHHYAFSEKDIKEISFIHELGKFYICLSVDVFNLYNKKSEKNKRKDKAGIDLGIHNPVCLFGGNNAYIFKMTDKELNRIHYLERRSRRLQSIMCRKTYGSKNYYKVLRKFRVTWYKIRNIRLNWRRTLAKEIAKKYKMICVDNFKIPDNTECTSIPKTIIRRINDSNRLYGMYAFYESLIHACYKYKTKYIQSPEKTTRTCSECGHENPKLPLSKRIFKCEKCGFTIDRDINASKNCYNYIL